MEQVKIFQRRYIRIGSLESTITGILATKSRSSIGTLHIGFRSEIQMSWVEPITRLDPRGETLKPMANTICPVAVRYLHTLATYHVKPQIS